MRNTNVIYRAVSELRNRYALNQGRRASLCSALAPGYHISRLRRYALLQRHVVNSEARWQRDVVGAAELDPHRLPGERTEIKRSSQNVRSRRAAILITKRRERCEQRPRRASHFNEETIENCCPSRFVRRDV